MRKILLIDGLGDFSLINEQYKLRVPDTKLLYIGGFCKDLNIKAKYIDFRDKEITRDSLLYYINQERYNTIFIGMNQDNKVYLDLLKLSEISNIDVFPLIGECCHYTTDLMSNIYLFSERICLEQNFLNLVKLLKLDKNGTHDLTFSFQCDYSLLENIENYNIPINIGTGCSMKCSFCSIANTNQSHKAIITIEKELDFLFGHKCKYFFIQNHSFCSDTFLVETLCDLLINKYSKIDYVWSFWGSIDKLKKYDDSLCELLIQSKLVRIELGVESLNKKNITGF